MNLLLMFSNLKLSNINLVHCIHEYLVFVHKFNDKKENIVVFFFLTPILLDRNVIGNNFVSLNKFTKPILPTLVPRFFTISSILSCNCISSFSCCVSYVGGEKNPSHSTFTSLVCRGTLIILSPWKVNQFITFYICWQGKWNFIFFQMKFSKNI